MLLCDLVDGFEKSDEDIREFFCQTARTSKEKADVLQLYFVVQCLSCQCKKGSLHDIVRSKVPMSEARFEKGWAELEKSTLFSAQEKWRVFGKPDTSSLA